MFLNPLQVPFHVQNETTFCGCACAQMVLTAVDPAKVNLSQATLIQSTNQSAYTISETGFTWASFPDGLVNTLNAESNDTLPFALYVCETEVDLSRVLVGTIKDHKRAPIVLVFDQGHWLVVSMIEMNASGTQVEGYYVHDPTAWVLDPHRPHSAADFCQDGTHGSPNKHVVGSDWPTQYATGIKKTSKWQWKFLAICQTGEVPDDGNFHEVTDSGYLAESPIQPVNIQRDSSRDRLLTAVDILESVGRLTGSGFPQHDLWRRTLEESSPAVPLLVQRTDRDDDYYYILPFVQTEERRVPLVVIFDAYTGAYQESIVLPVGSLYALEWIAPVAVRRNNDQQGRRLRPSTQPGQQFQFQLIWQPSEESLSRHLPFFEDENVRRRYYRIDGRATDGLHDPVP